MLTVTTVGTGVAFPEPHRGPTCQLLRHDGGTVVVDLGSGALQKLAALGVTPLDMGALLLSHAHLDHVADVLPMLFALRVPHYDRASCLNIYASTGTIEILDRVRAAWGRWVDIDPDQVRFVPVAPGDSFDIAGLRVDVGEVFHDASSVGFRFTTPAGSVLAIPADSGPCPGLEALCRDADLAIVECSVPEICPLEGHMHPSAVVALARDARIRRLALVHRYPAALSNAAAEDVAAALDIPVHVPGDGDTFVVEA